MFTVTESEAAAIRSAYENGGELSAVVELRRYFPGIADNENARRCTRTITGWTPPAPLPGRKPGDPDQIVDAVMARSLQANTRRDYVLVASAQPLANGRRVLQ